MVAVDDVVGAHVLQMDPLFFEELQSLVHILQTVDAHPAFSGLWLQVGGKKKENRQETEKKKNMKYKRMRCNIKKWKGKVRKCEVYLRSLLPGVHRTAPPAV